MKSRPRARRFRLLALGLFACIAVLTVRYRSVVSDIPAAAGVRPTATAPAAPEKETPFEAHQPRADRKDREDGTLPNEFRQRLLDESATVATSETPDAGNPRRTIKSRLLKTPFKYPHLRSDETWEEIPGSQPRLVKQDLYVADHVMVRFPASMTPAEVEAWCGGQGFSVRHRLMTEPVYLVATGSPDLGSTTRLLESVRKSFDGAAEVVVAERDFIVFPCVTPNDPSYSQLWGMHNTGQTGGINDGDIDAPEAWEFSTGSANVLVGVIDTGVDATHLDLRDNMWTNPAEIAGNGIDDDANGFIDDVQGWDFYTDDNLAADENGHGTHCSGTIGATGNNSTGVAGVCWDVSIVPIRFLGPYGGTTSDGIDSVNYSTALGVDLTSNSWGGGGFSSLLEQAIASANTAGILFVAAAGNDSVNNDTSPHYPSSYAGPNVISVASTAATDTLSTFSNYGITSVDLAAPGTSIYSTVPGNGYGLKSGTSMATPHVSGALALLRAINPSVGHLELKQHLLDNTDPLAALASITVSGGRLNVAKAAALLSGPRIVASTARIDIAGGNGDPHVNPGEAGEFVFVFQNIGSEEASGLGAVLAPDAAYPGISLTGTSLTIGNLAAGTHSAEFRIPFTVAGGVATPTLADFTLTITDASAETWTSSHPLAVQTSSTVTGRVTSVADGQPVTTALVSWTGPLSGSVNVDANGYFSFVAIDGSYSVDVSAPGFVPLATVTVTTPPAPAPLALQLGVPDLKVTPLAVNASIFAGSTTTTTVTLENRGNAPLSWTAITSTSVSQSPGNEPADDPPSLSGKAIGTIGSTTTVISADLTGRGATMLGLTFPLGANVLDGVDVLIIDDAIASATAADISAIRAWIQQGGGLFITADNSSSMGNVNSLLLSSGIQEASFGDFLSGTISNILPHPTTEGVTSLSLSSYGSQCQLDGIAVPLMKDGSDRTVGAATTTGAGRIVALCNEISSSISTTGGRLFANQAVDWLAKSVRWLGIADGTGILQPGESHTLVVNLQALGLNAGIFTGEIIILSNEPGNPRTEVPVTLTVIGSPAIAVDPASLAFPTTFVGGTATLELKVENPGTDTLQISALAFNDPAYRTTSVAPLSLAPGGQLKIPVTFSPVVAGNAPATLTLTSNSPVNPSLVVPLSGQGVNGPELGLNPGAFALTLPQGARPTHTLAISNAGDAPLVWSVELTDAAAPAGSRDLLQETLAGLDTNVAGITALIPNRFNFSDGVTGTYISDGGSDMYDGGNYLTTNLSSTYLPYSDGVIVTNPTSLGAGGRYFTRKHPGLFVFAAELGGAGTLSTFSITGGLGADGSGTADGVVLRRNIAGKRYAGLVKRVHSSSKPSVNHLVIVEDTPVVTHTFPSDTNQDNHSVSGLAGQRFVYYLLFATTGGTKVSDVECAAIMDAFVRNAVPGIPWLQLSDHAGTVDPAATQNVGVTFDTMEVEPGNHAAVIEMTSNDPARPTAAIPVTLTVQAAPVIEVSPNPITFTGVPAGTASQLPVEIRNTGSLPLVLSGVSITGGGPFTVADPDQLVLAPGEATRVPVLFSPVSTGSHQGSLRLTSNSPVSPVLEIPVAGTSISGGALKGTPASLLLTLESGTTGSLPLTLRNDGTASVTWQSTFRGDSGLATTDLSGLSVAIISSSSTSAYAAQTALTGLGATAQFITYSAVTPAALAPYRVAVIDSAVESLGTTQLAALSAWMAGGGSVLCHCSQYTFVQRNSLFTAYGISHSSYYHSTSPWSPYGTHFLTEGIGQITHDYAEQKLVLTGAAVPLLREAAGNVTGAVSENNGSRVGVFPGSISNFTGDNPTLFGRVVAWLGGKSAWLGLAPQSGTLSPQASAATTVNFDARKLFAGSYLADLVVRSTSTSESLTIPVRMQVTGTPDLATANAVVQFPPTHVGAFSRTPVTLVNEGTSPLRIDAITSSHPDVTVIDGLPALIAPKATLELTAEFRPTSVQSLAGSLEISSNDPDTPVIQLPLAGSSAIAPALTHPATVEFTVASGQVASGSFSIGNTGGSPLVWSADFGSPALDAPLEVVLAGLDAEAANISALIPGMFAFTDGVTGTSISDGGSDMFDNGNILSTSLSLTGSLPYSDGVIAPSTTFFGPQGRYFTRKHNGLFVLGADLDGVTSFKIRGGLGADGYGVVNGSDLTLDHRGVRWRGFVKRVTGMYSEPSVNHLILVPDQPGLAHTFPNNTNDDTHEVTGLAGVNRLYYLLYAGTNGGHIGDPDVLKIMRGFLDSIGEGAPWMSATPPGGQTAAGATSTVQLAADATLLYAGTYQTSLHLSTNDPARPFSQVPVTLTVTGAPAIIADPGYLSFPATILGSSRTLDLTIHNTGSAELDVSSVQLSGPFTTATAFPLKVAPGESAIVPICYTPGTLGFEAGMAVISSSAPNTPTTFVQLFGYGIPAPVADPSRTQIHTSLGGASSRNEALQIANSGPSPLHWEAGIDYGTAMPLFDRMNLSGLNIRIVSQYTNRFDTLIAELSRLGANASEVYYSSFTPALLATTDVLFIDYSLSYLSDANLQAINDWVFQGGSLMVTEPSSSTTDFNRLTQGSGIQLEYSSYGSSTTLTDIRYDITTVGVASVNTGYNTYSRLLVTGSAKPLVQWNNGDRFAATGPLGSGRVIASCGDIGSDGQAEMASNLRFLTNSLAWLAGRVRDWVEPVPASGIVGAHGSGTLQFVFDSNGLLPGTYFAEAVLLTDDPAHPEIRIPLSLEVRSTPEITVTGDPVDFDPVIVGWSATRTLTVKNTGYGLLTLSSATAPPDFQVVTALPMVLEPGRSNTITVSFAPTTTGLHQGELVLQSNAASQPALAVPVSGVGLEVPELVISPPQMNVGIPTGPAQTRQIGIHNAGSGHLVWKVADAYQSFPLSYPPSQLGGARFGFLTYTNSYTTARTKLTSGGGVVVNVASPVQQATLDTLKVLVIDDAYSLNATDTTRIRSWVEAGGSLLLTSETTSVLSALLSGTGISPVYNYRSGTIVTTPSPHPVNAGVATVSPYYPEAHFLLGGNAVPLLKFSTGEAYAAAVRFGRGQIIAIGNEALGDNDFATGDGERFAHQCLMWLANRIPWLEFPATGGSTPPGATDQAFLRFNPAGIPLNAVQQGTLLVESNDPANRSVSVPLSFLVSSTETSAAYAEWQLDHLGGPSAVRAGYTDDWNQDGLANSHEFFFAIDPSGPRDRSHLPALGRESGQMVYHYTRRTSLPDIMIRIRHSHDLATWTDLPAASLGQSVTTRDNGDGTTTVEVRYTPATDRGFFSFDLNAP